MTQRDLAARVGVHQTWISDIELGRGQGAPLALWVAIGLALGRPLAVALSRPNDASSTVVDAGHLEMQEALLALSAGAGRRATVERSAGGRDPWYSTDVAINDEATRTLILVEAWNTFGDVGAAIRSTHRKTAEAIATASAGERVATVWVVRATAANRAIIARYPNLFATTFGGPSRSWVRALMDGEVPPGEPGLVWFDPSTQRIHEWRRG